MKPTEQRLTRGTRIAIDMSKDGLIGFEAAIDLVRERVAKMGLCEDCGPRVEKLLSILGAEAKRRKVERLEIELLAIHEDLDALLVAEH